LRTDEKHIRTQSAILYKNKPKPSLLLSITVLFGADALFIRTKNTVGARSAQWLSVDIGGYLDRLPSNLRGRIPSARNRRSYRKPTRK
jgi:hypothetical protein